MTSKKKDCRRIISILGIVATMLGVIGCGQNSKSITETTVTLLKDGSVETFISEDFGQSYYDKDELQQMILTEVAAYNRQTGDAHIGVAKIEVADNRVNVQMSYATAQDYAEFNQVTFFDGMPQEALTAGYNLNVVLSNTKDLQETISQGDMLSMEGIRLIVTDTAERIILPGKVLYTSDNVEVAENFKSVRLLSNSEKLAYIIVKN